jgi:outer membrane lipoprotein-sorting protein
MKKMRLCFLLFFLISTTLFAQKLSTENNKQLQKKEDSLKSLSIKIIQGINAADRFNADSSFTKILVRGLKVKNSFYYPFDSLQTISKLYPPDSSFRIFTWQMMINENIVRQHGAIQMKTDDGSLKLFPLIDKSDVTTRLEDTISDNKGWIGAVYYKIIQKKSGNQNYYTLLGYDENNIRSNRKIIEVLSFPNDVPTFGGKYFSFEKDSILKSTKNRIIIEYKKAAGARLNYDADLDLILYEHLISESNEPDKKWTLVGDGDYEGFKWQNGKWVHIKKVFDYVTPLNKEPVPQPLENKDGKY